jgi:hypothetical protein
VLSRLRLPDREWLTQFDRRVLWGAAALVVLVVGTLVVVVVSALTANEEARAPVGSSTPIPAATAFRPRATPPGTAAPRPATFVDVTASIPVSDKVPPLASPTASPDPGLWRIEGHVVDESGTPIENVCVVIGPVACQTFTTKTDERGHYFLDVAQPLNGVTTNFDFFFEYPGRETVWMRVTPSGPTFFNLVLRKA